MIGQLPRSPTREVRLDCDVCTRPVSDARICSSCLGQFKTDLRSVPWLVEQLEVTFTRQSRIGERNGPRSAERPLPYDLRAAVDLETLVDGLKMWATAVAEQRGVVVDAERTAPALASWLLRWAGEVAQHVDAAELVGDVSAMVVAAERTIDRPAPKLFIGPCDACGADLYVGQMAKVVACRTEGCEFTADVAERRIWLLEQAVDQLRTAAELSRELPWIGGVTISRKMINQWAVRGHVTKFLPHPKDPRGYPRFRVGEIIDRARRHAGELAEQVAS